MCERSDGSAVRLHPHKNGKDALVRTGCLQQWRDGVKESTGGKRIPADHGCAQIANMRTCHGEVVATVGRDISVPGTEESVQPRAGMRVVPVDHMLYSQRSISDHLRNGTPVSDVISNLRNWCLDPLKDSWLILSAVEIDSAHGKRLHSIDNRRLYALKQFQEHWRHTGWIVRVRIVCTSIEADDNMERFMNRNRLLAGGREVNVNVRSFKYENGVSHDSISPDDSASCVCLTNDDSVSDGFMELSQNSSLMSAAGVKCFIPSTIFELFPKGCCTVEFLQTGVEVRGSAGRPVKVASVSWMPARTVVLVELRTEGARLVVTESHRVMACRGKQRQVVYMSFHGDLQLCSDPMSCASNICFFRFNNPGMFCQTSAKADLSNKHVFH